MQAQRSGDSIYCIWNRWRKNEVDRRSQRQKSKWRCYRDKSNVTTQLDGDKKMMLQTNIKKMGRKRLALWTDAVRVFGWRLHLCAPALHSLPRLAVLSTGSPSYITHTATAVEGYSPRTTPLCFTETDRYRHWHHLFLFNKQAKVSAIHM